MDIRCVWRRGRCVVALARSPLKHAPTNFASRTGYFGVTMNKAKLIFVTVLLLFGAGTASCQSIGDSVADSHIQANVPDEKDFAAFLKRDLEVYFKELKKKDIEVEYELLRDGPTQSGIAFPKFYVWVTVKENGALLEDGAVRVAAMEKKRFGVYDYLTRADIERDLEKVYQTFPRPVADKIKAKVGK
jgi:hypothetical protein